MLRISTILVIAGLWSPTALAQTVRIVDASGSPGSFADVNSAVAAAVDGDLILIKPGTYPSFLIDDVALTVVADGAGVTIESLPPLPFNIVRVDVLNSAAGRPVNLAGFAVEQNGGAFGFELLNVESCEGPVLVQDCTVFTEAPGATAALVKGSTAVSLVDCDFDASLVPLGYTGTDDAHALSTEGSSVYVYGCTLESGKGEGGDHLSGPPFNEGGPGPAGWRIVGGFGLGVCSTANGGSGGDGAIDFGLGCGDGGRGGAGIELIAGAGSPQLVASELTRQGGPGGLGGISPFGGPDCDDGPPGPNELVNAGSITTDDFPKRALETEYLVRVGQVKTERFIGQQFDLIWHIFGINAASPAFVPEITGALVVGSPYFLRFRGMVPASGQKVLSITVPENGLDYVVLYEQAFFYDFTRFYISNPQFSVILDDAF